MISPTRLLERSRRTTRDGKLISDRTTIKHRAGLNKEIGVTGMNDMKDPNTGIIITETIIEKETMVRAMFHICNRIFQIG